MKGGCNRVNNALLLKNMGHPIPKELKDEERIFSVPYLDLHFSKKASLYCMIATVISGITLYINLYMCLGLFVVLNLIAYSLASFKVTLNKFEGGNVYFDKYLIRKFKYKKNRNIYLRRRGK
ncbi:hypothetical protein [Clostridium butyricum]|uniref:hypothetical protein n=2 Tax=Clostridium butyricum TaxID=1492 RepID=UPI002AB06781|nr:hypothetical protein [Clostridium butyricum]